jgi:hypothetical protein
MLTLGTDIAARVFETLAAMLDTPPSSQNQLFAPRRNCR